MCDSRGVKSWKVLSGCLFVLLASVACGKNDSGGVPGVIPGGGTPGTYPVSTCGGLPTNPYALMYNNATVMVGSSAGVAALAADAPCDGRSLGTGLYVRAGDRVTVSFSPSSVLWGYSQMIQENGSWWIFDYTTITWDSACDRVTASGTDRATGAVLPTNGGLPMGLMISDGVAVYNVGTSGTQFTAQGAGMLRIGFNIPWNIPYTCGQGAVTITVTRS